jgi:hypothetical protein
MWETVLISIAISVVSMALSSLLAKRPQQQGVNPAAFDEFEFPQSSEGMPQIVVFGDVWLKDWHVLWYGNYRTEALVHGSISK